MNKISSIDFLKSAFTIESQVNSLKNIIKWVEDQNRTVKVNITKSTFSKLRGWSFNSTLGSLIHDSGSFFSIDGINIKIDTGNQLSEWDQPIINQPEIGYLGFIVKEFDGILHFLIQAKIEPGNVNNVQLSPTLQATRSNYTMAHKGSAPKYLEYFSQASYKNILIDQLQSEQGARFFKKRNRNIIVKIDTDIKIFENFAWLTLGQIKKLMSISNLVNMDTRTVISCINFGNYSENAINLLSFFNFNSNKNKFQNSLLKSLLSIDNSIHTIESIIAFMANQKSNTILKVEKVNLYKLRNWIFEDHSLFHEDKKYFSVIPVDVEIENREVSRWSQPMIEPAQEGICAFICKEIDGVLNFIVQSKIECGNFDIIEFAPTVQCLTGNYKEINSDVIPFLNYVLEINESKIIFDVLQSEEGGRFYKEQNRNLIVFAGDEIPDELPENYYWMTLNQISTFIKFNNYFNIQARSLIAAIPFHELNKI